MDFSKLFERKNKENTLKEFKKENKILPGDVRYALEYGDAVMGKNEIEILAMSNFENEAIYLIFKGLEFNPDLQREFLEKYTSFVLNKNEDKKNNREVFGNLVTETLNQSGDLSVKGGKLAQISRQGFDLWQEKFKTLAEELSKDHRNVFLIANSMILGLEKFIEEFSKSNKTLNILIPTKMEGENSNIGYSINFNDKKVEVQFFQNISSKKENSLLVDDTLHTGKVLNKLVEFWQKDGSAKPEILTLVDLSKKHE